MPGRPVGVVGPLPAFSLTEGLVKSFYLLRNEPPALARSRRRQQYESHAGSFPLTSNPEVLKLIHTKTALHCGAYLKLD